MGCYTVLVTLLLWQIHSYGCTKVEDIDLTSKCQHGKRHVYKLDFPSDFYPPAVVVTLNERSHSSNSTCDIVLEAVKRNGYLALTMEKMHIGSHTCQAKHKNYITVEDGEKLRVPFTQFCGNWVYTGSDYNNHKFISNSSHFRVKFKSFPGSYSMRFTVTALEGPELSADECNNWLSGVSCCKSCDVSFCVSTVLQCDKHFNCDPEHNGDEENCSSSRLVDTIVGVIGSVFVTSLIIGLCVKWRCSVRRRRQRRRESNSRHESEGCHSEDRTNNVVHPTTPVTNSTPFIDEPPTYIEAMRASQENLDSET